MSLVNSFGAPEVYRPGHGHRTLAAVPQIVEPAPSTFVHDQNQIELEKHRSRYCRVSGEIVAFFARDVLDGSLEKGLLDAQDTGIEVPSLYPGSGASWSGVAKFISVDKLPVRARQIPDDGELLGGQSGRFLEAASFAASNRALRNGDEENSVGPMIQLNVTPVDISKLGIVSSVVRVGGGTNAIGDAIGFSGDIDLEPMTPEDYQDYIR